MRPESHQHQDHERCCGTCRFAKLVAYKLDLLCFHGDTIELHGTSEYPVTADHVFMDDDEVGMLEGDAYDHVWARRKVDSDDVCGEWQPEATSQGGK